MFFQKIKRETGFKPATLALARRYSTTEPLAHKIYRISSVKRVMGIEPTYLAWKASVLPLNYTAQCPKLESNQRHEDFQSSALPTELSGHFISIKFSFSMPTKSILQYNQEKCQVYFFFFLSCRYKLQFKFSTLEIIIM